MRGGVLVLRYYLTAVRSAKGSRIPLTWSLAPGGWDGLSRLQGSAGGWREAGRRSGRLLIGREKEELRDA